MLLYVCDTPFKLQLCSALLEVFRFVFGVSCLFILNLFLLTLPIPALASEGALTVFISRSLGPPNCRPQGLSRLFLRLLKLAVRAHCVLRARYPRQIMECL